MTTTARAASTGGVVAADRVTEELAAVLARLGELTDAAAADPTSGDREADAARIDQVALLERIQAAAAATQAALMVGFARSQVAIQQQAVLADPRAVGRGIADQLALACRVSSSEGSRRLGVARALHAELSATGALLRDGLISAYVAGLVASETRHLDPDPRRAVDGRLAAELADCAPRRAAMLARRFAYETGAHGGIVGANPTRRCFDGILAALVAYRDGGRCREPYCDAPARQIDHIVPHRAGGPTTFANGRSTCVRSNQAREMPGWSVRLVHDGLGTQPHTVTTTTPTGHTDTSRAGPAPSLSRRRSPGRTP